MEHAYNSPVKEILANIRKVSQKATPNFKWTTSPSLVAAATNSAPHFTLSTQRPPQTHTYSVPMMSRLLSLPVQFPLFVGWDSDSFQSLSLLLFTLTPTLPFLSSPPAFSSLLARLVIYSEPRFIGDTFDFNISPSTKKVAPPRFWNWGVTPPPKMFVPNTHWDVKHPLFCSERNCFRGSSY